MKKSDPPKLAGPADLPKVTATGTKLEIVPTDKGRALAKPTPRKFRDFNRFVNDVEVLVDFDDGLNGMTSGDIEDNAEWCQKMVAKCKAGLEQFNRRENLDDPDDDESDLSQAYIAKRITAMVASFPNANPSSPEGYMQMLVEHVSAIEGLSEVALEGACREIVVTQKFAPAISEVMEVVRKHVEQWCIRRWTIHSVERYRCKALEAAIKREQEQEKQEHEREVERATYLLKYAMEKKQQLAQEIENAKAELASYLERHPMELAECIRRRDEILANMKNRHAQMEKMTEERIANCIKEHAEAEARESELSLKLQALMAENREPAAVTDSSKDESAQSSDGGSK
jgi:hypothetical protein